MSWGPAVSVMWYHDASGFDYGQVKLLLLGFLMAAAMFFAIGGMVLIVFSS